MSRLLRTKGKGVASSSSPPPPKKSKPSKFASAASRDFHPERNISHDTRHDLDHLKSLQNFVAFNMLDSLAFGFAPFNETLVREFYLSFPDFTSKNHKELAFTFKGKRIVLSPSAIEEILGFYPSSDDDIESFANFSLSVTLTSFMAEAYLENQAPTPKIMSGKLKNDYRVFWLWVRYNIFPSTQKSDIPLEGCRILSAMQHHRRIPIPYGTIIYDSLIRSVLGKPSSKLFFPCLIMKICKFYKIREAFMDLNHPITSPIDVALVRHSTSHCPRDVHEAPSSPTLEAPHPSSTFEGSSSVPPPPLYDVSRIDPNLYGYLHSISTSIHDLRSYVETSFEELSNRIEEIALDRHGSYDRDDGGDDLGPS
jgi:hypothetical protein